MTSGNTKLTSEDLDQMRTLGDVARFQAKRRPEQIAFRFEGRDTSFAAFNTHTNQVGNALQSADVSKGQRIAYIGKNSDHYFELFFGAAKIGAIMVPIGWRLAPAEMAYMMTDSQVPIVFVGPEVREQAQAAIEEMESTPRIIHMEDEGTEGYVGWRDAASTDDPAIEVGQNDVAIQLYTSGTTGRPKGAMLNHVNLLGSRRASIEAGLAWNDWGADDVSLVAMPIAHIGGTGWGIIGVFNGARGVVAREFDPYSVLDFIEKEHVSKMFMVPAALQIVVREPRAKEVDFSRLNYILYGASPIPLDLLRECMEVFGCGFCQQYGLTETTGTIVYLPPEDHDPNGNARMRAAGLPMPGTEIRVVDEDGNEVPRGTVGEVAIKSCNNMVGYWGLEEATAKTIRSDGWLLSGDAGYMDEDGYLFIHDRVKDMIISGGENIYPAEVESALYGHPDVAEVAIIGVPHEKWGETVKAIVAPKPGTSPSESDIIEYARTRIARFKVPTSVDFIDALPRNPSGKILKRELRKPYWEGRDRQVS